MESITRLHIRELLNSRDPNSNKTTYGHAFLLAGNVGKIGAAVLSSRACLRSGVGLLTTCIPKSERSILQTTVPEAMVTFRDEPINFSKITAMAFGPGIGVNGEGEKLIISILEKSDLPLVMDADAITILAQNENLWQELPKNTILTPHQGEFDRLFGPHSDQESRIKTAETKAKEHECIFVMKGHHTKVVSASESFENDTGNSGLAKGGSGDALTGIICAFLAQGYKPFVAAQLGVFFHGFAADFSLEKQSKESMLASDVIENLGAAFQKIHGA